MDEFTNLFFEISHDYNQNIVNNMCEILDRIENKGRTEGRTEALIKDRISMITLMQRMFDENRVDDLKRASMDSAYMDELLKEYHLAVTFEPEED